MPTWDEFAWAAFLYGAIGGNYDYQGLMRQTHLLGSLRTNPTGLQTNQIQQKVVRDFLNRWKCRVQNTPQSANAIQTTLQNLLPYTQILNGLIIATVNFTQQVNVNNSLMTVGQVIVHCYTKVRNIKYKFGPTATSKLLHILQPELFIMWDKEILSHYRQQNRQVSDSGQGYCAYLEFMEQAAMQVHQSFRNAALNPPATANQTPAVYLSTQMNYNSFKTLAKYLDEYNWVTITRGVQVPPPWHP